LLERELPGQKAAQRADAVAQPDAKPISNANPDSHPDSDSVAVALSVAQPFTLAQSIAEHMTRRSTLYLLRHAKSSWADESVPDLQRPLAPRGRRAAQQLARYLRDHRIAPEVVLCSPALRTLQTLELIQPGLGAHAEVLIEDDLYGAGEDQLLARLRSVPDDVGSVLLIGHNPGIQDLAVLLVGGGADRDQLRAKFPTAALATIGVARGWARLGPGEAKLVAFRVPRGRP
jgi:phosphohistidine phosphatase